MIASAHRAEIRRRFYGEHVEGWDHRGAARPVP